MEKDSKEKGHTNINALLKVAVPIAFTTVGIIFSKLSRKSQQRSSNHDHHQTIYPETMPQHEIEERSSSERRGDDVDHYSGEDETEPLPDILLSESAREISVQSHDEPHIEEQIDDMKSQVMSIEDRHIVLETQFQEHCNMREQESTYQKLQIMCLGLKIELLEAQNQKLVDGIAEVRETINQVDAIKTDFRSLERNVKKLNRRTGVYSDNIVKEISRGNDDFCRVKNEMEVVSDQIYKEIKGIEEKLITRTTKMEEAEVQENKKLFENLQQLREQWSAEMQELIYVGWVNACLRNEILMAEENENRGNKYGETENAKPVVQSADEVVVELPYNEHAKSCSVEHYDAECSRATKDIEDLCSNAYSKCSRKPRLMRKIKGWAKGKEKCKSMHSNWDCLNS